MTVPSALATKDRGNERVPRGLLQQGPGSSQGLLILSTRTVRDAARLVTRRASETRNETRFGRRPGSPVMSKSPPYMGRQAYPSKLRTSK
jgi:hypothetical protein